MGLQLEDEMEANYCQLLLTHARVLAMLLLVHHDLSNERAAKITALNYRRGLDIFQHCSPKVLV